MDSDFLEKIKNKAETISPLGGKMKFLIGDICVYIDGTGEKNTVAQNDSDADCTIATSMEVLEKLKSGRLNPMMAIMTKKVKITGDISLAMKLKSLI